MKTFDEIRALRRCNWAQETPEGFRGFIIMPSRWTGTIIATTGAGWEHVSVCPQTRRITPSWDDMCFIKDLFWNENEAVIQIHPAKSDYINNVPNCLHLWRCKYQEMLLPPKILVGVNENLTREEFIAEVKAAYELAGEEF